MTSGEPSSYQAHLPPISIGALQDENHRLRADSEQRIIEIAALAERLDLLALAFGARDKSWLDDLDAAGREFDEERRQLLAEIAARDALVGASAARQTELEAQLAEATQGHAREAAEANVPLPRWRPNIMPFRSSPAA